MIKEKKTKPLITLLMIVLVFSRASYAQWDEPGDPGLQNYFNDLDNPSGASSSEGEATAPTIAVETSNLSREKTSCEQNNSQNDLPPGFLYNILLGRFPSIMPESIEFPGFGFRTRPQYGSVSQINGSWKTHYPSKRISSCVDGYDDIGGMTVFKAESFKIEKGSNEGKYLYGLRASMRKCSHDFGDLEKEMTDLGENLASNMPLENLQANRNSKKFCVVKTVIEDKDAGVGKTAPFYYVVPSKKKKDVLDHEDLKACLGHIRENLGDKMSLREGLDVYQDASIISPDKEYLFALLSSYEADGRGIDYPDGSYFKTLMDVNTKTCFHAFKMRGPDGQLAVSYLTSDAKKNKQLQDEKEDAFRDDLAECRTNSDMEYLYQEYPDLFQRFSKDVFAKKEEINDQTEADLKTIIDSILDVDQSQIALSDSALEVISQYSDLVESAFNAIDQAYEEGDWEALEDYTEELKEKVEELGLHNTDVASLAAQKGYLDVGKKLLRLQEKMKAFSEVDKGYSPGRADDASADMIEERTAEVVYHYDLHRVKNCIGSEHPALRYARDLAQTETTLQARTQREGLDQQGLNRDQRRALASLSMDYRRQALLTSVINQRDPFSYQRFSTNLAANYRADMIDLYRQFGIDRKIYQEEINQYLSKLQNLQIYVKKLLAYEPDEDCKSWDGDDVRAVYHEEAQRGRQELQLAMQRDPQYFTGANGMGLGPQANFGFMGMQGNAGLQGGWPTWQQFPGRQFPGWQQSGFGMGMGTNMGMGSNWFNPGFQSMTINPYRQNVPWATSGSMGFGPGAGAGYFPWQG